MTTEQQKRMADLEALIKAQAEQLELLKASKTKGTVSMRVSDSGYVEVFGLPSKGRFSISLAPNGWEALLAMGEQVKSFIKANQAKCDAGNAAYRAKKQVAVG